ncbi:hypothetical protein OEJ37_22760, partial [Burkholderia sp. BKH01]|uniref:hypothetical protein n=1 Tax=Burkholderia sp. BKH01 TaxID=2769262 RepID=UPI0021E0804C
MKKPAHKAGFFNFLAERTGLACIPQAAAALASAALRVPPQAAQAASSDPRPRARGRAQQPNAQTKMPAQGGHFRLFGGADGTRTRDPRRDRPVF